MNILNNPETSSAQKNAAMDAVREALTGTLNLLQGLSGLDLEQYKPAEVSGTDYQGFMDSMPAYDSPAYRDWYDDWVRKYGSGSTGSTGSSSDEGDMGDYDPFGNQGGG